MRNAKRVYWNERKCYAEGLTEEGLEKLEGITAGPGNARYSFKNQHRLSLWTTSTGLWILISDS